MSKLVACKLFGCCFVIMKFIYIQIFIGLNLHFTFFLRYFGPCYLLLFNSDVTWHFKQLLFEAHISSCYFSTIKLFCRPTVKTVLISFLVNNLF